MSSYFKGIKCTLGACLLVVFQQGMQGKEQNLHQCGSVWFLLGTLPLCKSFHLVSAVTEKYNFTSKSFDADMQSTALLSVMHQEMPESHHWQLHHLGTWLILQLVSIC